MGRRGHAPALPRQAVHGDVLADRDAAPARRPGKAGGDQIGVGKARLGLEADQRGIVEIGDRQQFARLRRVQPLHRNALRLLLRQRVGQRRALVVVGRRDQVAAAHQAAGRVLVADIGGEIGEGAPRAPRQLDVLAHRIVGAQDARGLRRGAGADGGAVQHQHAGRAQGRQMVGDRTADHARTDHNHVITLHGHTPRMNGGSVTRAAAGAGCIGAANTE